MSSTSNVLLTAGGSVMVLVLLFEKSRRLFFLLFRFLGAYVLLTLETKVWHQLFNLPGPLPRNLDEVLSNPKRFEKILKRHGVLKPHERLGTLSKLAGITSEPAKQLTAGSISVSIFTGECKTREVKWFLKFQTGRGLPRFMQALRIASEFGVFREIDFYSHLRLRVPVHTIPCVLALKSRFFNYVLLVLEHVDLSEQYLVVNDADSVSVERINLMLSEVAKIHVRFMGASEHNEDAQDTSWIPAKQGLDFVKWLFSFQDTHIVDNAFTLRLLHCMATYFEKKPVTLLHGDCRPGNMMFSKTKENVVCVFADWEATNVGPVLWDFTYCTTLGYPAKVRREHQMTTCLSAYLSVMTEISRPEAQVDVSVLTLLLAFVSRTIRSRGFWDKQGNESKDQQAWVVRVLLAVEDINVSVVAKALNVENSEIVLLQQQLRREVNSLNILSETREEMQ